MYTAATTTAHGPAARVVAAVALAGSLLTATSSSGAVVTLDDALIYSSRGSIRTEDERTVVHAHGFVASGTGSLTDPWIGKDGAGGIRDAIASVPYGKAVLVMCSKGVYQISHTLQLRANSSVAGVGMNETVLLHTPFTSYGDFGSMATGSALWNLTLDGNRWAPTSAGLCVGGVALHGPAISVMSVRVQNFGCAAFSPSRDADGLSIVDCVSVDSHYFVWAEATCGYGGHRYL
eukprot:COSAG02_NODE_4305_length_5528_cov_18.902376_1_plen_233_part_10